MLVVADLCPYWTWIPTSGGAMRVFNINRVVAERACIRQFSARPTFGHVHGSGWLGLRTRACHISQRYLEYQYFHPLVIGSSYVLYRSNLHSDLCLSTLLRWLAPARLRQVVAQASILQVEHPWLFELALELAGHRPIVYVAHNVEAELWEILARQRGTPFPCLAQRARRLERHAVQRADAIVAMSTTDAAIFEREYDADPAKIFLVPNGADLDTHRPATSAEKAAARRRLGLDNRPLLLFIGSDHYPNKVALHAIQQWQIDARVQYVVVGDVGRGQRSGGSLRIVGPVPDLTDYLMAADIALNPLTSGGGTSLKLLEYLACGLPTITTSVGMRGVALTPGRDVLVGDIADFPTLVTTLIGDPALRAKLACNGRQVVEQQYGWHRLGARMFEVYDACLYHR